MWPVLKDGDRVEVTPCLGKPGVGQLVVARAPSGLLVHRVLRVTDESVVMAGDNSHTEDAPVQLAHLAGVVSKVERKGKTFVPVLSPTRTSPLLRLARRTLGAVERRWAAR
jgi:hypothetical protein